MLQYKFIFSTWIGPLLHLYTFHNTINFNDKILYTGLNSYAIIKTRSFIKVYMQSTSIPFCIRTMYQLMLYVILRYKRLQLQKYMPMICLSVNLLIESVHYSYVLVKISTSHCDHTQYTPIVVKNWIQISKSSSVSVHDTTSAVNCYSQILQFV